MNVIKRTRADFHFIDVEVQIELVDVDTTDIYFINTVDARQVYDVLNNSRTFDDDYNKVCVKDSHTLSITGEVDIHYNYDYYKKVLTITSFA
jgi:hypothetical protein|nr:MAG TPA: hypothetical protein [Crassvirales sp.]